jgi:hypothetical protein
LQGETRCGGRQRANGRPVVSGVILAWESCELLWWWFVSDGLALPCWRLIINNNLPANRVPSEARLGTVEVAVFAVGFGKEEASRADVL